MAKKPQYIPREEAHKMVEDALRPGGPWDQQGRIIRLDGMATLALEDGHVPLTRAEEKEFQLRTGKCVTFMAARNFEDWYDATNELWEWLEAMEYQQKTYLAVLMLTDRRAIELSGDPHVAEHARHYMQAHKKRVRGLGEAIEHSAAMAEKNGAD